MLLDLHVHSYYSSDSANKPSILLKKAKKLGIALAITDHNNCNAWTVFKKENLRYNVPLIFGEEIKVYRGREYLGELLGYFMLEEVKKNELDDVLDSLKEQNALISAAHPFDYFRPPLGQPMKELDYIKKKINAVEAFNSRCYFNSFNRMAQQFAKENSLAVTAGSDAHFPQEFGNALTETEASSLEEFRELFSKNRISKQSRLSGIKPHYYTAMLKNGIIDRERFFE